MSPASDSRLVASAVCSLGLHGWPFAADVQTDFTPSLVAEEADRSNTVEYAKVGVRIAREVMRLGELQIQAQITLTIGANQRAATLCGIFTTAAIATFAAVGAAINGEEKGLHLVNAGIVHLINGGMVCGLMLFMAAMSCVGALWPSKFFMPGNKPGNWLRDDVLTGSISDTMLHEAENYQENILFNEGVLRNAARFVKWGAVLGTGAPFGGIVTWAASRYFLGV